MDDGIAGPPLEVRVWSKMACFTRPESKAERVSYLTPTPSAARGVLEAIFWKPEFEYRVREIVVLEPIRFASILRNEVNSKASPQSEGISITDDRTQRHSLVLLDTAYIFRADIVLRPDVTDNPAKYRDQFRRRVRAGQCYHRPYLGCREFAADFDAPTGNEAAINDSRDLGLMLFDIAFASGSRSAHVPLFFEGRLDNGVVNVPDHLYETRRQISGPWLPRLPLANEGEAAQ